MSKEGKKIYSVGKLLVLILVVGLGLAIYFFTGGASGKEKMPQGFLEARLEVSDVSNGIVDLMAQTNEKIKSANALDLNNDSSGALALIKEAKSLNDSAHSSAFQLSHDLQKMAESLSEIHSLESRSKAYEATVIELSLVSEFISYTESLNNFLDSLNSALINNSQTERENSDKYLKEVNEKAGVINSLNQQFLKKIGEFDKSF